MRLSRPWVIVACGVLLAGAFAAWSLRESPERERAKQARADAAPATQAEEARPALYRWVDERGTVHYSDQPPRGRRYTRIEHDPNPGIEVDGNRQ